MANSKVKRCPSLSGIICGAKHILSNLKKFDVCPQLPLIIDANDDYLSRAFDYKESNKYLEWEDLSKNVCVEFEFRFNAMKDMLWFLSTFPVDEYGLYVS